jgi:hypothetical protein
VKRRSLLRGLGAAVAFSVAGCASDGSPENDGTDTDEPTDTDGSTPTDTPTDGPVDTRAGSPMTDGGGDGTPTDGGGTDGVTDQSLSITDSGCGAEVDEASVSFDDGVTVTGTIWGNDACYTATLRDIRYTDGELVVAVAAESTAETDTACAPCITEIDYEVSVTFDGDGPESVTVAHIRDQNRTTVATADR